MRISNELKALSDATSDEAQKQIAATQADAALVEAQAFTQRVRADVKSAMKRAGQIVLTHDEAGRPVAIVPDGSEAGYHLEPMLPDDTDLDALTSGPSSSSDETSAGASQTAPALQSSPSARRGGR